MMRISTQDLQTQFARALSDWAFIGEINDRYGFPPALLYAVASRETNMRNVVGDGGHGHGVFQLDDRYHNIPAGFDADVRAQADIAASMLGVLWARYGDWVKACNAYNSGSPVTSVTAGGDYGPDVMARQQFLSTLNPGDDMLQPDERDALYDVREQMTGSRSSRPPQYPGWPAHADTSDKPKTLVDYVRALHAEQVAQRQVLAEILAKLPK